MKSIRLKFANKSGIQLSGRLDLPISGRPKAYALFAHCFTCSKNLNAVGSISSSLIANNIAVFRFDFTGLGQSKGDFEDTNFSSNLDDLVSAYSYLEENYHAPQVMIGHSLGGAAVLHIAGQLDKVEAVVTIGAPFDPPHVKKLFKEGINEIETKGEAIIDIGGRPFKIKKQLLDDLERNDAADCIGNLRKALLVLHSPQDNTVGIENAGKIYEAALHPKSFISLDGADHLMSDDKDSKYAGHVIATWANRYIQEIDHPEIEKEGEVLTRTPGDTFTTEILAGDHFMIADEPADVGGKDLGPSPYGYLTAALGACTSMTLRMYAERKGWDLQEARVHLTHNKKYADDCADCENPKSKLDHFDRIIELEGDLDENQRARLLDIADKCPVHKTLHSEVHVQTTLKE